MLCVCIYKKCKLYIRSDEDNAKGKSRDLIDSTVLTRLVENFENRLIIIVKR